MTYYGGQILFYFKVNLNRIFESMSIYFTKMICSTRPLIEFLECDLLLKIIFYFIRIIMKIRYCGARGDTWRLDPIAVDFGGFFVKALFFSSFFLFPTRL